MIDRVDDSAPAPVFVGAVASIDALEIGEYGVVDGNRLVYAAARERSFPGDEGYIVGPEIELAGFTGTLSASDVIFI